MNPIELNPDDLLGSIKKFSEEFRRKLLDLHEKKGNTSEVIRFHTEAIDRLLISLYQFAEETYRLEAKKDGFRATLLSQGGYGRRELCLHSDIDLLLLFDGKCEKFVKFFNEKIIQNLWDSGSEVGLAVRTVKDCRRLMEQDITILASLLDARYLAGDRSLEEDFRKMFDHYLSSKKNRDRFLTLKKKENEERRERYGGSVYRLEPNLKEGEGGLRDYHTIYWLARVYDRIQDPKELVDRGYLTAPEFSSLWQALEFLWEVRNELHRRTGRRADQLLFEHQEPIAHWLGFENTAQFLGVELFMQRYYREAAKIDTLNKKALRRFESQELSLFPPPGRPIPKILTGESFREMLADHVELGDLLGRMNDSGLLGTFLPEFEKLRFRVQHDAYHVYTVDIHSIFAVGELEKLARGDYATAHPTLTQVIQDVRQKGLLAFAVLYHDIGKGEGSGHVEKGAPLIRQAGARLGFTPEEVDLLEFLERSHLMMTHLAFRRDLEDQNLIIRFARAMPSLAHLNLLYILTFCDVKAVSAEAMTSWKSSLLEYLYLKTRGVLQNGTFTKERASELLPKVLEEVLKLGKAEGFFSIMSPRYLLATPPATIVRHAGLWKRFESDPIVFEARSIEKEQLNEVTLFTWESPTLFPRMAGLFASHTLNILEAQLNLSKKGHALHVFKVTDHEGRMIEDPEKWGRVERDLRDVLERRVPIETLVAEKFRPSLLTKKPARVLPTRVEIDNDVSPYYTVIDIYANDRVGLLYQITSTLAALGLTVDVSKISTKVDQVADTFYVKDIFGHKITSADRLKKIQEVLKKVIEEEPTPGWRPPKLSS